MKHQTEEHSADSPQDRQIVLHPLLFALNPIVFLYAQSFAFVDVWSIVRSTVLSLAITAFLWLLLRLLLGDLRNAALLTSIALTLFFAYGAITETLAKVELFPAGAWVAGAHLLLFAVAAGLWGSVALLLMTRQLPSGWTYFANVFGTVAVVFPLAVVGQHAYTASVVNRLVGWTHETIPAAGEAATQQPPDIYWILPDAYARADILAEVYNYNDEPFLNALRERDFSISPRAVSNYSTTVHSVASALNLDYMHNLVTGEIQELFDWRFARRLLNENRLVP